LTDVPVYVRISSITPSKEGRFKVRRLGLVVLAGLLVAMTLSVTTVADCAVYTSDSPFCIGGGGGLGMAYTAAVRAILTFWPQPEPTPPAVAPKPIQLAPRLSRLKDCPVPYFQPWEVEFWGIRRNPTAR